MQKVKCDISWVTVRNSFYIFKYPLTFTREEPNVMIVDMYNLDDTKSFFFYSLSAFQVTYVIVQFKE